MSLRTPDLLFTAIAPAIWGSTYIVTTQYLPNFSPMTVAMLRALPAGLLLVMIVRQIPTGIWWMRIFILGALNISLFWSLLFISVYRLPGGVAATVGAVQPLMVVFISAALLGSPIRLMAVLGAICGTAGVALLVLTPNAALDPVGVAAGLAGAVSMAFGTVLTGTVAKLAMRQPFVLFKGLTFQKTLLTGRISPGDHHNKMLRHGLCVVHASPQYL